MDHVITFEELGALLLAAGVDTAEEENLKNESPGEDVSAGAEASREGRTFALGGSPAESIVKAVDEEGLITPCRIDGLDRKTIKLLKVYARGKAPGNFLEVMACKGGCVAGPCTISPPEISSAAVKKLAAGSGELQDKTKIA